MATVYLAERADSGERVALKVLASELAEDERFRQRFLRESELAASLEHPNTVPIIASGEEDGVLYLAMRYVEGADLREILRREGRFEPERALALAGQVASALDAAHAAGLIHRDVKPANVLVAPEEGGEHSYLCDFGLARHVSSAGSLTGDRGFVGTIDYVSPEQIEGGTIDGRTDLYSLGCLLYECLAGKRPFERESELSVVFAHLNEPPARISDLRPELPQAFDSVFETALAKSPADRYGNCGELIDAAHAALEGRTHTRWRARRRGLLAAAAAALIVAAGVIGGLAATGTFDGGSSPAITPTAIAGEALGLTDSAYNSAFGVSAGIIPLRYPSDYAVRTYGDRKVSVLYASGDSKAIQKGTAKAVEIVTWNANDRTSAGVGPCSTVAALKAAYGHALKPSPSSIQDGKVYGYAVGRLFFATGPAHDPKTVQAVALYRNPLPLAGFNALNAGPCT